MCEKMQNYIKLLAVLLILITVQIKAQTCGFGCFGLGGFYAGYGFENYKASGLNDYIKSLDTKTSLSENSPEFKTSKGFRLGVNLFRTKYRRFLFTAKGYYQFLKEEKNVTEHVENSDRNLSYSLNLNYWGVGFDLGHVLFEFVDFKILDVSLNFHTADLSRQEKVDGSTTNEEKFNENKVALGYSIGTGLVFKIVGDYISLEATSGYNHFSIGQMKAEDGSLLVLPVTKQPVDKFVSNGGFFGVVQLNVGIPLY